jgi:hypothetical protein
MTMGKQFHLSDIISCTTGHLISTRHIDGVYDLLGYMTGISLTTHEIPRANRACALELLIQHPRLREVTPPKGLTSDQQWLGWRDELVAQYGEYLDVEPLPAGVYEVQDPIAELIRMRGGSAVGIIPVVTD